MGKSNIWPKQEYNCSGSFPPRDVQGFCLTRRIINQLLRRRLINYKGWHFSDWRPRDLFYLQMIDFWPRPLIISFSAQTLTACLNSNSPSLKYVLDHDFDAGSDHDADEEDKSDHNIISISYYDVTIFIYIILWCNNFISGNVSVTLRLLTRGSVMEQSGE